MAPSMARMPRSIGPVVIVVGIVSALLLLFVGELVGGAIYSALEPLLARSLEIIAPGSSGPILAIIAIASFVGLVLAVWGIIARYR